MANNDVKMRFKATDQTAPAFGKIRKNLNLTNGALLKLSSTFAAAFSIVAITRFGKESLDLADSIAKTADSVGVNVEFLQRYQFVAQQAGLTTEEFNKSMQVFAKMTGEAMTGTGEAKMALDALGISLRTQDGRLKTTEELFIDFFKATDDIANAQKKAAYFADVFGRAGVKNTVMAKEGTKAMQDMATAATGIFSEETIRNAENFNDTMNKLNRQVLNPIKGWFIDTLNDALKFGENIGLLNFDITTASMKDLEVEAGKIIDKMALVRKEIEATDDPQRKKGMLLYYRELGELLKPIRDKINGITNASQKLNEISLTATEKINNVMMDYIENLGTVQERTEKAAVGSMKKFEDTLVSSLKSGKLEFKDFSDYVIEQLLRIAIQEMLLAPFKTMMTPFFGSFAELFRADGGSVKGGSPYIVGERGAELFVPNSSGQIITNENLDTMQGVGSRTVSVNFNISTVDASGFDQLLASRKGMITAMINNSMNARGKMGVV